jgi:hypothetical protein
MALSYSGDSSSAAIHAVTTLVAVNQLHPTLELALAMGGAVLLYSASSGRP